MDVPLDHDDSAPRFRLNTRSLDLSSLLARYWEVAVVAAFTGVGAFIRLWRLTVIPWGFHNDEGNVVIDAQRILHEGWIGPYSLNALGYPIAINYYIAPFIKVFGASVFGVRFPIALLGIISIPLAYAVFRIAGGWRVAICGTVLYSFSMWHIHLSRVGFPVMGWQVTELGSLLCIQLGLRTRKWWYFAIAGVLIGLGTWVYNSAFLYGVAVAIWLAAWFVLVNYRRAWDSIASFRRDHTWDARPARDLMLLLILLGTTLLAARPLIQYARDPKNAYTNHFKSVYVFGEERRQNCLRVPENQRDINCKDTLASGFVDKTDVVRSRVVKLYHWLTTEPHPDGADGLGVKPPVGRLMMYLAIVGAFAALLRVKNAAFGIGLLAVPLIFISTSVTIDGQFRRSFGLLPFIALSGGLVLGLLWEWGDRQFVALRAGVLTFVIAILAIITYQHVRFYFHTYPDSANERFVFFPEMREASEFIDSVGHPYVYWYSERATLGHESRRVLAPNIAGGEERVPLGGAPGTPPKIDLKPSPTPSYPAKQQPDGAVWVFFGGYEPLLDQVAQRYPGGVVSQSFTDQYNIYDYKAYYLPNDLLELYSRQESISYPVRAVP